MSLVRANITTTFKDLGAVPPNLRDDSKREVSEDLKADPKRQPAAVGEDTEPARSKPHSNATDTTRHVKRDRDIERSKPTESRAKHRRTETRKDGSRQSYNDARIERESERDFERTDVYRTIGDKDAAQASGSETVRNTADDVEDDPPATSSTRGVAELVSEGADVAKAPERVAFELVELYERNYPDEPKLSTRPVKLAGSVATEKESEAHVTTSARKFDPSSTGVHRLLPDKKSEPARADFDGVAKLQREGVFGQTEDGRPRSVTEFMRAKEYEYQFNDKPFTVDAFLRETETAIYDMLKRPHVNAASRELLQFAESVNSYRNHITAAAAPQHTRQPST
jgi:hypothetical protein